MPRRPNTPDDVWKYIDKGDPERCWMWTGSVTGTGYGQMRLNMSMQKPHRVVFFLHNGWWPGLVRHKCHNPLCCNPKHLDHGTVQDNSDDMVAAGRQARREKNGRSVLTEPEVLQIRGSTLSGPKTARAFGVSSSQVYRIWKGQQWCA